MVPERVLAKVRFAERTCREGDGLFAIDGELRCVHWGAGMESITGLRAREMLGRKAFEALPFLADGPHDRFVRAALAGESSAGDGELWVPETARRAQLLLSYFPLEDDDGSIVGAMAMVSSVTERKRLEQILQETESRFKNMADVSPVLLWMAGPDSLCTFFNQTWLDFTGRPLDAELGVGWAEGIHFEDFQGCMDTYMEAFNARRVFEMEYRLRRADGEYRWVLDRGTPRYTPEGSFAGYIGSCIDITSHKHLEIELRNGLRARDDFLSIASHELRTPLTTLQLRLEALSRTIDDKGLTKALGQVARLTTLVDEMLDVSRLSIGKPVLTLTVTNLSELARDVAAQLEPAARAASAPIAVVAPAAVEGEWDHDLIECVVLNLMANAVKYGAGSPVSVAVTEGPGTAVVSVKDGGPGIAESDHLRIFERFERAASTRNYGGFGVGLWIARELVTAHGGRIEVESKLGSGATFSVILPVRPS